MTSAIITNTITTNYPVAGQDNDSQGFRDNFTAIQAGLVEAASELTALQTVAILSADLATQTTPVVNNLLGSTISNALYNQFSGKFVPITQSASSVPNYLTISSDFTAGAVQQFNIKYTGTQINFANWPVNNTPVGNNYYSVLRIILSNVSSPQVSTAITFGASLGGVIKVATGDTLLTQSSSNATMTLGTTGLTYVIEAWTVNSGATVFIKSSGTY
jgi:hypothetical protein